MAIRFRFSLRVLLVLMLLFGALLVPFVIRLNEARQQKEAVEALAEEVSLILYDYQFDENGRMKPENPPSQSKWMRQILGDDFFCRVRFINFKGGSQVTDSGLEHMRGMKNLSGLNLTMSHQFTDAGLEHLSGLKSLETLSLYDTRITDAGLEHLTNLPELELLDIRETKVTPEGAAKLKRALPNCKIVLEDNSEVPYPDT